MGLRMKESKSMMGKLQVEKRKQNEQGRRRSKRETWRRLEVKYDRRKKAGQREEVRNPQGLNAERTNLHGQ